MGADLGDVIGSFAAAIANARRIADEQTVAIAEYYKQHPLLGTMSAPRIRLPEVTVQVPIVVDAFEEGDPGLTTPSAEVAGELLAALRTSFEKAGEPLPRGIVTVFRDAFLSRVEEVPAPRAARERYARAADHALALTSRDRRFADRLAKLPRLSRELQAAADKSALTRPPRDARFEVTVLTSEVKELSDPASSVKLTLSIREEGVEWAVVEQPDGTEAPRLVPE